MNNKLFILGIVIIIPLVSALLDILVIGEYSYIEYLYYSASETVAFVIGLLLGSKFISPTKLKVRVST